MTLSSMTGFARADGVIDAYVWSWELKSVNSKGLDLRLRVPTGWDVVEAAARARTRAIVRGTFYANLSVRREGVVPAVRINESVLAAVLGAIREVEGRVNAQAPTLDGILNIKGVIEVLDEPESEGAREAAQAAVIAGFDAALATLLEMRQREGDALKTILSLRLDEIASLAARADAAPGRRPEAVRARLAEQVAALLDGSNRLDPDRLHQEALVMAAKADVREEIDRLTTHVDQARRLIAEGGAIGRRLDFLSQELNREANTLCSKSNDVELTNIGLELKSVVEQFREQVQNLE
ncbi:MAG: YicC/YloC family endoribonuclease [Variibacter sp.]